MVTQPRVIFRVEPEKPIRQQAVQNLRSGADMEEADLVIIKAALQTILNTYMSALKRTSQKERAFLSCFKNEVNWSIVLAVLKRCEKVIEYCLGYDSTEEVRESLGTLRFIKAGRQRLGKKDCGILASQAGKTIWLYEEWWKVPSLRSAGGIRPEKGHVSGPFDGLADALMQTQEGTLFHELVHLASRGQMRRLLPVVYQPQKLPSAIWHGGDLVGDTVMHQHANVKLVDEAVIDAKYCRPIKGGGFDFRRAYHLAGVRDLAFLRGGDVGSVLNADSYSAFAALALMRRVEIHLASNPEIAIAGVQAPNLHSDTINRLRQALSKSANKTNNERRKIDLPHERKPLSEHSHLGSIAARNRRGRFSDLSCWPTPADASSV